MTYPNEDKDIYEKELEDLQGQIEGLPREREVEAILILDELRELLENIDENSEGLPRWGELVNELESLIDNENDDIEERAPEIGSAEDELVGENEREYGSLTIHDSEEEMKGRD